MKEKYKYAFMDMAERFGKTSEAERLQVGCLIHNGHHIISEGCNGQPPGWHTESCEDSDGRTEPTVRHAELAALEKLWTSPETAEGAYVFVSHAPCLGCAIKLATAKVAEVYYRYDYRCDKGVEHLRSKNIVVKQLK